MGLDQSPEPAAGKTSTTKAAEPSPALPTEPESAPISSAAVLTDRQPIEAELEEVKIGIDLPAPLSPARRIMRAISRVIAIGCLASLALVSVYRFLPPPVTPLMLIRLVSGEGLYKSWTSYEEISPNLARAVIASEDSNFCQHSGFDWSAMDKAWQRNRHSRRILGGSTISNQTAKNIFLWPDRTYIRKAFEFYFTVLIEQLWTKKRILEVYLNVVEWGPGVYGAEAAARTHFKKSASQLTYREAALLAAVLPNPLRWSPSKPSSYVRSRAGTIEARMMDIADPAGNPCPN